MLNVNASVFTPKKSLSAPAPSFSHRSPCPSLADECPELEYDEADCPRGVSTPLILTPTGSMIDLPAHALKYPKKQVNFDFELQRLSSPEDEGMIGLGLSLDTPYQKEIKQPEVTEPAVVLDTVDEAYQKSVNGQGYLSPLGMSEAVTESSSATTTAKRSSDLDSEAIGFLEAGPISPRQVIARPNKDGDWGWVEVETKGRTLIPLVAVEGIDDVWPETDLVSPDTPPRKVPRPKKTPPRSEPVPPPPSKIPSWSIRPAAIRWAESVKVKIQNSLSYIPRGVKTAAEAHLNPSTLPAPGPSILKTSEHCPQAAPAKVEIHGLPDNRKRRRARVVEKSATTTTYEFPTRLHCCTPNKGSAKRGEPPVVGTSPMRRDTPGEKTKEGGKMPEPREPLTTFALIRAFRKKDKVAKWAASLAKDEEKEKKAREKWEFEQWWNST
ncbi:hypothetical protein IAT40_001189 [Kwoniella sp. CBS 6097]